MSRFRRICVFCGSNVGDDPAYAKAAIKLGKKLADQKIGLVYGGAKVGLMGAVSNAVLVGGGDAIGVIPEKLQSTEIAHQGLTELFVVESMHARKTMMAHLSDAFIVMPGGWGTLEEMFEILTWGQLRMHDKPLGLLNVRGYFDGLMAFADHAVDQGFLKIENRRLMASAGDPEILLRSLELAKLPEPVRGRYMP